MALTKVQKSLFFTRTNVNFGYKNEYKYADKADGDLNVVLNDVEQLAKQCFDVLAAGASVARVRLNGFVEHGAAVVGEAGRRGRRGAAQLLVRLAGSPLPRVVLRRVAVVVARRRDEQLLAEREARHRRQGGAVRRARARRAAAAAARRGAERAERLLQPVVLLLQAAHLRLEVDALLLLVHPVGLDLVEALFRFGELVDQLTDGRRGRLVGAARRRLDLMSRFVVAERRERGVERRAGARLVVVRRAVAER